MTAKTDVQGFNADHDKAMSDPPREAWQAPTYTVLLVADAETGVNSTTDTNATFS